MSLSHLTFRELRGLDDELLLPWLDLYETAFPPPERVLVSAHLRVLQGRPDQPGEHHLLATLNDGKFAGLARYQSLPEAGLAYLWYLATLTELRSQGIGAETYREIMGRVAREPGVRALLIEVEIPAQAGSAAERALAERRIAFYRRLGAQLLEGIDYLQVVGPHQPPVPMHLMFHPFRPLAAQQAFGLGRALWGKLINRSGELRLA